MTGEVQAKVALASKAEMRAAVENAKAAQPEWAATNPQRRVRVLMKFLELVARDNDSSGRIAGARTRQDRFPTPRATFCAAWRSWSSRSAFRS